MVDFLKLIQNENMKIYRRVRTWIMFGFIGLLPLLICTLYYAMETGGNMPSNWSMMELMLTILTSLITIFTVVKAADAVAGEFSQGTIKLLLIRPWGRSSILLSKYLAVLLFGLTMMLAAFVVTLLFTVIFFGYTSSPDDLGVGGDSPWAYMFEGLLYQFIGLIVIATFGFMMSSAFRSSGLAIGLSMFILFSGSIVSGLLALTNKPWIKYVLFPHLDLSSYRHGGDGPVPGYPTTLGFSLGVLAVYTALFIAVSWIVFRKRDVAA